MKIKNIFILNLACLIEEELFGTNHVKSLKLLPAMNKYDTD